MKVNPYSSQNNNYLTVFQIEHEICKILNGFHANFILESQMKDLINASNFTSNNNGCPFRIVCIALSL